MLLECRSSLERKKKTNVAYSFEPDVFAFRISRLVRPIASQPRSERRELDRGFRQRYRGSNPKSDIYVRDRGELGALPPLSSPTTSRACRFERMGARVAGGRRGEKKRTAVSLAAIFHHAALTQLREEEEEERGVKKRLPRSRS